MPRHFGLHVATPKPAEEPSVAGGNGFPPWRRFQEATGSPLADEFVPIGDPTRRVRCYSCDELMEERDLLDHVGQYPAPHGRKVLPPGLWDRWKAFARNVERNGATGPRATAHPNASDLHSEHRASNHPLGNEPPSLDYSRKHSYHSNFREHGRFGSHPSHDDHSDEGDS